MNKILVQIGDGNTAAAGQTLVSYALGSCIGVCLYDKEIKIAGMVHAVLPAKKAARSRLQSSSIGMQTKASDV